MDFEFSPEQTQWREAIFSRCSRFDDAYWLRKDREGGFPEDIYRAVAQAGWLGSKLPCGPQANAAKCLAAEAAVECCQTAMLTHGGYGYGYAKECHVEHRRERARPAQVLLKNDAGCRSIAAKGEHGTHPLTPVCPWQP